MNVVLYSTHCVVCKRIQKTMDLKGIPYTIVDDREQVLQKAEEFNTNNVPFATIDGKFVDTAELKNFCEGV